MWNRWCVRSIQKQIGYTSFRKIYNRYCSWFESKWSTGLSFRDVFCCAVCGWARFARTYALHLHDGRGTSLYFIIWAIGFFFGIFFFFSKEKTTKPITTATFQYFSWWYVVMPIDQVFNCRLFDWFKKCLSVCVCALCCKGWLKRNTSIDHLRVERTQFLEPFD